jgi:hypothetical protein
MAHEVRPGNRLMFADEIEHNAAVDITRRLTRGHLEIVQINFTHGRQRASVSGHWDLFVPRTLSKMNLLSSKKIRGSNKFGKNQTSVTITALFSVAYVFCDGKEK